MSEDKGFSFKDIDEETGMQMFEDITGGFSELFNGSNLGYYETESVAQARQHGQQRGAKIGKMAGAALTPLLGPLGAPLGGLLGGLLGGNKAKNNAQEVVAQKNLKKANTQDMFTDLHNQNKTISDQESAFFGRLQ